MRFLESSFLALGIAALIPLLAQPAETLTETISQQEIERLIDQLGSKRYNLREQATKKLSEMDEALPVLVRARASMDLEMSRRADLIITALKQRRLRALLAKGKEAEIDLLLDELFASKGTPHDDCWGVALQIAREMVTWAHTNGGEKIRLPDHDFLKSPCVVSQTIQLGWPQGPEDLQIKKRVFTRAVAVKFEFPAIQESLLLCHQKIRANCVDSIVFVNGNIERHPCSISPTGQGVGAMSRCVNFCDGDIRIDRATECLLVATGEIKIKSRASDSVIVENAKNPFPFLKLFDLSTVGIEVGAADKGVLIKKVHEGKAFASGGILKGDVLLAIREAKDQPAIEVTSPEGFRRQVRRLVAGNRFGFFQIQRAGKVLELVVSL